MQVSEIYTSTRWWSRLFKLWISNLVGLSPIFMVLQLHETANGNYCKDSNHNDRGSDDSNNKPSSKVFSVVVLIVRIIWIWDWFRRWMWTWSRWWGRRRAWGKILDCSSSVSCWAYTKVDITLLVVKRHYEVLKEGVADECDGLILLESDPRNTMVFVESIRSRLGLGRESVHNVIDSNCEILHMWPD